MNNKKYRVLATKKGTKETIILESELTEKQALKFCESWGWAYDDGQNNYWLDYELIEF